MSGPTMITETDDLAARYVLPSLDKMLAGMADGEYAYRALLEAIRAAAG